MTDPFVTEISEGNERVVLPKGAYKFVVTDVKFSPASEWPEWKQEAAVTQHNTREDERKERFEKDGKEYTPKYVDSVHDLPAGEAAQFIFYPKVASGKFAETKARPIYTGITLNNKKEYRTKSNLYKLYDAALPDVEALIADGKVDAREVIGYPFMAQVDFTDKGNNKYTAFIQSDDHGTRLFEPEAPKEVIDGVPWEEGEVAPW